MYKVIGIDEAGKGPVIGSMFIGFAIINLDKGLKDLNSFQDYLKDELGVKDSKKLTHAKRIEIFEKLKDNFDIKYVQLTPANIDQNNKNGGKLNQLEIDGITKVLNDHKPDLIIIDALTSRPDKFVDEIRKHLNFDPKIISENKADDKYPIVGAASIIAKELREQELAQIKQNIKIDCGSGYPSDPKTKEFLKKYWKNSEFDFIFRKSWQTYKNVADIKENKSILDY